MHSQVEQHIRLLLHLHDCVIIPGFGALIASYQPATKDDTRGLMMPPSKALGFNRTLTRDDGLLTHHISQSEKISYTEAAELLKSYVRSLQDALRREKQCTLPEVGEFVSRQGKIVFEPSREENYLTESYGLYPVSIVHEARRSSRGLPVNRVSIGRRLRPVLIALPVLAVLGAMSYFSYSDPQLRMQLSSIIPGQYSAPVEYRERYAYEAPTDAAIGSAIVTSTKDPNQQFLDLSEEDASFIWPVSSAVVADARPPQPDPEIAKPEVAEAKSSASVGQYNIVAGCFSVEENAEKQVAKLKAKGVDAHIAGKVKGLYRVVAGSYPNRDAAVASLAHIKQDACPGAWLWNNHN